MDLLREHLILSGYVIVAGAMIVLASKRPGWKIPAFVMQIAFGALFSAFVVFYVRSASFSASWMFLLFLVLFFVGNEFFRARYERFVFQTSVFFIALFSYAIFALPILLGKIGAGIFLLSGAISVAAIGGFARLLKKEMPKSVLVIFALFNIFYFANIIPPIPLALKESGIYHRIERINGSYRVLYEKPPWYRFFDDTSVVFHTIPGKTLYAYSAIFAPVGIQTDIVHRWSYFDENKDEWFYETAIRFPITGGRENGYRGYTFKRNARAGRWRVDVQTPRGQTLGRMTFRVVEGIPQELTEAVR